MFVCCTPPVPLTRVAMIAQVRSCGCFRQGCMRCYADACDAMPAMETDKCTDLRVYEFRSLQRHAIAFVLLGTIQGCTRAMPATEIDECTDLIVVGPYSDVHCHRPSGGLAFGARSVIISSISRMQRYGVSGAGRCPAPQKPAVSIGRHAPGPCLTFRN